MSENTPSESIESLKIPEEFKKLINDFIVDILNTFPEYEPIIKKWWKTSEFFDIEDQEERENAKNTEHETNIKFIFKYCLSVFPERFLDILYQNIDIFSADSGYNTEFLPGISFKYLWQCDITDKTRETIWKYLQLIMLSLISSIKNKDAFGDTASLFENIDKEEFKNKLEEILEKMQNLFDIPSQEANDDSSSKSASDGINMENFPNAQDIHGHISSMIEGKLGQMAKEIAEETAKSFDMDGLENATNTEDVFKTLLSNPTKLMGLVKNVGEKLDSRLKSGEINEKELFEEATSIMSKMKNMKGMDNIQSMLSNLGMAGGIPGLGRNQNQDVKPTEEQTKNSKLKEKLKKKMEMKNFQLN